MRLPLCVLLPIHQPTAYISAHTHILLLTDKPILLLGPTAIHGYALTRLYPQHVQPIHSTNQRDARRHGWPYIELEDATGMAELLRNFTGAIVYAHAVCDVERCEEQRDWAYQKNIVNLERILQARNPASRFIYLSSDHVFGDDGEYDEDSAPRPISYYAETRLIAEQIVLDIRDALVVRVPLSIGPSVSGRVGHLDWIKYRYGKGLPITIIEDEARSAVAAAEVADRIVDLAASDVTGLRHLAARSVPRTELADAVFDFHDLPRTYRLGKRADQPAPHLGRVTVSTRFADSFSLPLTPAVDFFYSATPSDI